MCLAIDEMRQDSRNEGIAVGRAEGIESTRIESIKNVMSGLKYTAQQAMELLKIPKEEQEKYYSRL